MPMRISTLATRRVLKSSLKMPLYTRPRAMRMRQRRMIFQTICPVLLPASRCLEREKGHETPARKMNRGKIVS